RAAGEDLRHDRRIFKPSRFQSRHGLHKVDVRHEAPSDLLMGGAEKPSGRLRPKSLHVRKANVPHGPPLSTATSLPQRASETLPAEDPPTEWPRWPSG